MDNDDEFEQLLNNFISTQLQDIDTGLSSDEEEAAEEALQKAIQPEKKAGGDDKETAALKSGEKALFKAYRNFRDSVEILSEDSHSKMPPFRLIPEMLMPHYKPKTGKIIAEDTIKGWDIMIKANPQILEQINPGATDEQLLNFAEKSEDDALQFALISYVEILIEMEGCEISYKERRLKREKRRLERQIYEEHQQRIARANRYIEAVKEKNFPIDAERLVKNYFKTAQKDAEGAFKVLTQNPAFFAPIEFSKIKPRLFGLLKVKPQDGIRLNRIIGEFLKKLKA